MNEGDDPGGPLDVPTLELLGRRSTTHPLVDRWALQPDHLAPRRLTIHLDDGQYPDPIEAVRFDIRWDAGGTYAIQYRESRGDDVWDCRWDRHPKPGDPMTHFHPPPNAGPDIEPSQLSDTHPLDVCVALLDWAQDRVAELYRY